MLGQMLHKDQASGEVEIVDGCTFWFIIYLANAWIDVTQGPSIGGNLK